MRPHLLSAKVIEHYLSTGQWSKKTVLDQYRTYARNFPNKIALLSTDNSYTWAELDAVTDSVAAKLISLGLIRDSTALIQLSSSCNEVIIRIALKKSGVIGAFAPIQWGVRELDYICQQLEPSLIIVQENRLLPLTHSWLIKKVKKSKFKLIKLNIAENSIENSELWPSREEAPISPEILKKIKCRQFKFDEISMITTSSGTSGMAKLCEWPEGAQVAVAKALQKKMNVTDRDIVGLFAPMSGAAGLVVWIISTVVPFTSIFPTSYNARELLNDLINFKVTMGTTVPVILNRLVKENLESYDLSLLRLMRVGTASTNITVAKSFEERTGCKIIVASGSMEVPGFSHAHFSEKKRIRLDGSVGLPLEGGNLKIEDEDGNILPTGSVGELKVSAPYASTGYWKDPAATEAVWSDGWFSTGDLGRIEHSGRLTLFGRKKEIINRSGLKIRPVEIEMQLMEDSSVIDCAVIAVPDNEYGEVAWAFVVLHPKKHFEIEEAKELMLARGIPAYKIPERIEVLTDLPRINDNKIDKTYLKQLAIERSKI